MKEDALKVKLRVLEEKKQELQSALQQISRKERIIEDRIIEGLKPVFDLNTHEQLSRANIQRRIAGLADEIIASGIDNPILIGVMNGALPTFDGLIKQLDERKFRCQFDVIQASSYHGIVSGELKLEDNLKVPVGGRNVVIVDDVCDTGKTAKKIIELMHSLGALSATLLVLVNKQQERAEKYAVDPQFVGFTLSKDAFIAGWGMDYEELLRGYYDSISAIDPATLPQGEEKALLESKNSLNKELKTCIENIKEVTDVLVVVEKMGSLASCDGAYQPRYFSPALQPDSPIIPLQALTKNSFC